MEEATILVFLLMIVPQYVEVLCIYFPFNNNNNNSGSLRTFFFKAFLVALRTFLRKACSVIM